VFGTDVVSRIGRARVVGLFGLATGAMLEAIRVAVLDAGWIASGDGPDVVLLVASVVGFLVFAAAFGWLWYAGRRLDQRGRESVGDERAVFLTRRIAVGAFVASYLFAVVVAALPPSIDLPGRAVALGVVAVGAGALAAGHLGEAGS
jgi:hypothetical protein